MLCERFCPLGGIGYARIPSRFDGEPDLNTELPKGTVMAKTKFRPLHDRVVVKRIDAEEKTKGGIIIPDSAKEKPRGRSWRSARRPRRGRQADPDRHQGGDRVLFGKWSGTEVKLDGEDS